MLYFFFRFLDTKYIAAAPAYLTVIFSVKLKLPAGDPHDNENLSSQHYLRNADKKKHYLIKLLNLHIQRIPASSDEKTIINYGNGGSVYKIVITHLYPLNCNM